MEKGQAPQGPASTRCQREGSVSPRFGIICDDNAQDHTAGEQRDEDPGDHGAAVLLLGAALMGFLLRIARLAVDVGCRAEHARYRLRNAFRLSGRWSWSAVVVVRIQLDVVLLRDSGILPWC